jgi:hypothetical protein
MVTIGVAWPHLAHALEPSVVVTLNNLTHPLSGSNVEVGGIPGQIDEDDGLCVSNHWLADFRLPG